MREREGYLGVLLLVSNEKEYERKGRVPGGPTPGRPVRPRSPLAPRLPGAPVNNKFTNDKKKYFKIEKI